MGDVIDPILPQKSKLKNVCHNSVTDRYVKLKLWKYFSYFQKSNLKDQKIFVKS